ARESASCSATSLRASFSFFRLAVLRGHLLQLVHVLRDEKGHRFGHDLDIYRFTRFLLTFALFRQDPVVDVDRNPRPLDLQAAAVMRAKGGRPRLALPPALVWLCAAV